ncbi:hypothetical protein INT45_013740 [Circinella minor]|uniref:Chromo domain-containing protein n=1 Tax=Circinella minor TaxID=1195481 RepID=A0A8H7VAV3_9FUNG|nr:hypothetical protein INT45_013740 [Circinella minor]
MSNSPKREEEESGSEGENEYEVEKLVAHRRINQRGGAKNMYLVKWKNYSAEDNTWEKEEDIFSQELIDAYWQQQEEKKKGKRTAQTKKRSTLESDDDKSTTTTAPKSKQRRTLVNSPNSNRRKSSRQSSQNDNDNSNTSTSNSSSSADEEEDVNMENERAKEAPVITRDIHVKPLEGYQWSDARVVSHIFIDTAGNLLAKITWPNGEETYSSTNLVRATAPHLLLDFYEAHLKFGPIEE